MPGGEHATEPSPEEHPVGEGARSARRTFPEDWVGRWSGELRIEGRSGMQTVGFSLEIGAETDAHGRPWRLGYEGQPARDYRLVEVDAAAGHWQVDERNGIVLDATLSDRDGGAPVFFSSFAVGAQLLTTRQAFHGDRIEHEILVVRREASATGSEVGVHPVVARQWAVLRPVSD